MARYDPRHRKAVCIWSSWPGLGALCFVGALTTGCDDKCSSDSTATGTVNVATLLTETEDELNGATVVVNSVPTTIQTPGTLLLAPGSHTISATLDGQTGTPVEVEVGQGSVTHATVPMRAATVEMTGMLGLVEPSSQQYNLHYRSLLTPGIETAITQALADQALLRQVTVAGLLAETGRTLAWKEPACKDKGVDDVLCALKKQVPNAWYFDRGDQEPEEKDLTTSEWVPQGITTSDDASADGLYDSKRVAIVTWYGKNKVKDKGLRVSFFETPEAGVDARYLHVLLATPVTTPDGKLNLVPIRYNGPSFKIAEHDAGGMAWYKDLLYVACGNGGFHIFDLRRIYAVAKTVAAPGDGEVANHVFGRRSPDDGKLYGANHDFVLLEVGHTTQMTDCARVPKHVQDGICFAGLSLDRSGATPALVTAEYRDETELKGSNIGVRIVRWNLDGSGALEMASGGEVTSDGSYVTDTPRVQGVVMQGDHFYISSTGSPAKFFHNAVFKAWPKGGEAISYWPAEMRLWSLTEKPSNRWVFSVSACAMGGGPGCP